MQYPSTCSEVHLENLLQFQLDWQVIPKECECEASNFLGSVIFYFENCPVTDDYDCLIYCDSGSLERKLSWFSLTICVHVCITWLKAIFTDY